MERGLERNRIDKNRTNADTLVQILSKPRKNPEGPTRSEPDFVNAFKW